MDSLARDRLKRALADPAAVRQAMVLSEVLGPPVALREERDGASSASSNRSPA
ncbi:MAG: hypothetical protein ACLFRV_14415 [Acidimicrobiales bacterium]